MATAADAPAVGPRKKRKSISPDLFERLLAIASIALLAAICAAIVRGRAEWGTIPPIVWFHLATILAALVLTPVLLLQRRGTRRHRRLGWAWATALFATAAASLFIRDINNGGWSWIHVLSAITLVGVPSTVLAARTTKWRVIAC